MGRRFLAGALAIALVSALVGVEAVSAADEEERYVDGSLGFSFAKPRFTPSEAPDVSTVAVTLAASGAGGFAPNVNVLVHNQDTTLEAYGERQRTELESVGWQLVEQRHTEIGQRRALRSHAKGSVQGVRLEFVAVALIGGTDRKRVFVLTCTATAEQFPHYREEFERVIASFALAP